MIDNWMAESRRVGGVQRSASIGQDALLLGVTALAQAGRLIRAGVSLSELRKRSVKPAPAVPTAKQAVSTSQDRAAAVRRRRWFRGGALLVPIAGLALLELALRLIGYGYPAGFLVRHTATGPDVRVENQRFPWRFFPHTLARHPNPLVVSPEKPAGVYRILILGESAAEGDPAPAFGFSRVLQVLLEERCPGRRYEIVNAAFTAINSHAIVPIARDCRPLQADVWLVYMGNNEVVGPFGTGTVFGKQSPPLPIVRANLALKATRTGQLIDAVMQRLGPSREAAAGWGGMSMFLEEQVRLNDPRLAVQQKHFQKNLREIIELGRGAGARVIVSTMVSRLQDWPPFGSLHRPDLTQAQQLEWERIYQAGVAAEKAGDLSEVLRKYEQASQLDDEFAELHFRWGRCCLALGRYEEARNHFVLARDLDTLRFRADTRLNESIRETVTSQTGEGVRLIEADKLFDGQSENRISDGGQLCDHVHFTFAGNYLLARLFADEVAAGLPPSLRSPSSDTQGWLTEEECARRLGYTDTQRHEIANLILRRLEEPIYSRQLDHGERLSRVREEIAGLRGAVKPTALRRALEVCRTALESAPDDWRLHEMTARLLSDLNDHAAAEIEWRRVSQLIPHAAGPHTEIGKLQQQQGNAQGAVVAFRRAVEVNPDYAEAHAQLGAAYGQMGKRSEAIRSFRKALQLDPTRSEAMEGLARLSAR